MKVRLALEEIQLDLRLAEQGGFWLVDVVDGQECLIGRLDGEPFKDLAEAEEAADWIAYMRASGNN